MIHLLHVPQLPIFEQLQLEEAILRQDERSWVLINEGTPPAIVMGISGKKEELIDPIQTSMLQIPLIRRFSGGGTVIVDENTLFVTFICQKELASIPLYPEPIHRWVEEFYSPIFPGFRLRENDYVFGEKKFGGNAQYIKKGRFLHHTSFLWDYDPKRMSCLLHPKKTPTYRAGRSHEDFLCRLSHHFPSKESLVLKIKDELSRLYPIIPTTLEQARSILSIPHRQTVSIELISH